MAGKAREGQIVQFDININSHGKNINAAEVYLKFNPKYIKVLSVDKSGSFFELWIPGEPQYSNKTGTASFVGGLPNPGLTGKGKIGTVKAKLLKKGDTQITFTNESQMLLNDGHGTAVPLRLLPIRITIK